MKTEYTVGEEGKTLIAKRSFQAPLEKVWQAWTSSEKLDAWWGPLPYRAVTDSYDFSAGGEWRYRMVGPEGDAHHCINKYVTIVPGKEFTAVDSFCNEDWSIKTELPESHWTVAFTESEGVTSIVVTTTYATPEALQTVSEMGMKEGFDMGLNQLEALLAA